MVKKIDKHYREWIRTQECANPDCLGFAGDIIPAHQRILGNGGIGIKPPDKDILPLCFLCHDEEHTAGAIYFWQCKDKAETKEYVQQLCNEHLERYNGR